MAKKSETLRQREQAQRDLLELKKMQMGQIDPASLPKEEPIVPKTLEEKKQNFLYYHKYKVIVAVAVAAVLSFLIYSGVTATKYDAKTAIFCYRFLTTDQASAIGAYLENYYPDMNENGKVDIQAVDCSFDPDQSSPDHTNTMLTKIQAMLVAESDTLLYLLDEKTLAYMNTISDNLELFEAKNTVELGHSFYEATGLKAEEGEKLYLCLRTVGGTVLEQNKKVKPQLAAAEKVLEQVRAENEDTVAASGHRGHVLLSSRSLGTVKRLVGDVDLLVFLVNDKNSSWDDKAKADYDKVHRSAVEALEAEAAQRGVGLDIKTKYQSLTLNRVCGDPEWNWIKAAIKKLGVSSLAEYQQNYLKKNDGCNTAPVIFVLNKEVRSFTYSASKEYPDFDECSSIGKSDGKFHRFTIEHELLHQFGAEDFYYPADVKALAEEHLDQSIMLNGFKIDPVTEYIIGWNGRLSLAADKFLKATAHHTNESIEAALDAEWGDALKN